MPSMSLSMPHGLGQEEALRRLKTAIEKAKARNEGKVTNLKEVQLCDLWIQYQRRCHRRTQPSQAQRQLAVCGYDVQRQN